jgi:hypothetical protein
MPEARVGQRRAPAVGHHPGDAGARWPPAVLPGLRQKSAELGRLTDVGGVLVKEGKVFLETVTFQPIG